LSVSELILRTESKVNRVIVVEDDHATRESIALTFELGFRSVEILKFDRIKPVVTVLDEFDPDLITIDLGLPDGDGFQLIRQIRERSDLPIIVLSGRGDDSTILSAIRLGADGYLVKPFSTIELQAHVEALMRRATQPKSQVVPEGKEIIDLASNISLDLGSASVVQDGVTMPLSAREVDCLSLLVKSKGKIVTYSEFKEHVWGSVSVSDAAIKMVFYRLRKSLGDDDLARMLIQSHRGIGYSLGRQV